MAFKFSDEIANSPTFSTASKSWNGIEFRVSHEDISNPTVWEIHENHHTAVIHLDGKINKLETQMETCAKLVEPPMSGELWLIPAQTKYSSEARGNIVNYAEVLINPRYFEDFFGKIELQPKVGHFDNFLFQNVLYLSQIVEKTDDISELLSENLIRTIGLHILKTYNHDLQIQTKKRVLRLSSPEEKLVQNYISENLQEPITLKNLANLIGISTHNFLEFFGNSFGTTPAQFIINQRLRQVRWLLSETKTDITTIAFETGFSSHSHLSNTFKKTFGATPQEFRKIQNKNGWSA